MRLLGVYELECLENIRRIAQRGLKTAQAEVNNTSNIDIFKHILDLYEQIVIFNPQNIKNG